MFVGVTLADGKSLRLSRNQLLGVQRIE